MLFIKIKPVSWRLILLCGTAVLLTVACGTPTTEIPAAEIAETVAEVEEVSTKIPTEIPTEIPTDTPEPTATPLPTETATEVPTETPEPTETPLPTETATHTPEPTETSLPTNTPVPTNTPGPTNTPVPADTATPEAEATPDEITVFYISNPNDILGVFPVRPFDADGIRANMNRIHQSLNTMKNNLNGAKDGDAAACDAYVGAYNNVLYSGVFYEPVPGDWQEIDQIYFLSFIFSLDRTRPAYLSCVNAGKVDEFNYGLALQTIDQTLNFITPAINAAAAK